MKDRLILSLIGVVCLPYFTICLVIGCMDAPKQREIVLPPPPVLNTTTTMVVGVPSDTVSGIFQVLGTSNTISVKEPLVITKDDFSISLPAGSSLSYTLSPTTGDFIFSDPKPTITTKLHGITIHPVLNHIRIEAPDKGTAYVTWLHLPHSQEFSLSGSTSAQLVCDVPSVAAVEEEEEDLRPGKQQAIDNRPVVYLWTMKPCVPCDTAKRELGLDPIDLKKSDSLPFRVELNPSFDPDQDNEMRPFFQWKTPQGQRARYGWNGLDKFKLYWEKSQKKVPVT